MPPKRKTNIKQKQKQNQRQTVVVHVHNDAKPARRRRQKSGPSQKQRSHGSNYIVVNPTLAVSNPVSHMYSPHQASDSPPLPQQPAAISAGNALLSVPSSKAVSITGETTGQIQNDINDHVKPRGIRFTPEKTAKEKFISREPINDDFIPQRSPQTRIEKSVIDDYPLAAGGGAENNIDWDETVVFKKDNYPNSGNALLDTVKESPIKMRKTRRDKGVPRGPYNVMGARNNKSSKGYDPDIDDDEDLYNVSFDR